MTPFNQLNSSHTMSTRTINDWHPETSSLIATLAGFGFTVTGGYDDDEGGFIKRADYANEAAFLDVLLSCDVATLRITRQGTKESTKTPGKTVKAVYSLFLVMGNSPGELVSDYGVPAHQDDAAALDKATDTHFTAWDGRKQPTRQA